jgi:arylsulfatase A-like enzyme
VRYLDDYTGSDPFLMYVAYTAPHDPRSAPEEYQRMYNPERLRVPENFAPEHPFDNGELKIRDEMLAPFPRTKEIVREHIAAYYAMISHMDAQIGRVLTALKRSRHAGNTIVVFASDNGLAVGRHGLLGKQSLYDHSVRVPLIMSGTGIPREERTASLCYLYDLFPTLCGLTGLSVPPDVEGSTLMPALRKPGTRIRDSHFLAYRDLQRGVTTGDWKLIRYRVGTSRPAQLFHLKTDPNEMNNQVSTEAAKSRLHAMDKMLDEWMKRTGDPVGGLADFQAASA